MSERENETKKGSSNVIDVEIETFFDLNLNLNLNGDRCPKIEITIKFHILSRRLA